MSEAEDRPLLEVERLARDVWRHTSWKLLGGAHPFPSSGLIIKGESSILVVDTTWPVTDMHDLIRVTRSDVIANGLPVRIAVTHAHEDRMSGLDVAREYGIRSLAHELTQADAPGRGLPLADETWRGRSLCIDLGGRSVELYYPGPAHTRDNVAAFIPDVGLLFGGCQVRQLADVALGNVADANVLAWPRSARRLIARYGARANLVVPGHGAPGGAELLEHTFQLAAAAAGNLMAPSSRSVSRRAPAFGLL